MNSLRWVLALAAIVVGILGAIVLYVLIRDPSGARQQAQRHGPESTQRESTAPFPSANRSERRACMTLRVLLADGRPASGARVTLGGRCIEHASADAEGCVLVRDLPDGSYDLIARRGSQSGALHFEHTVRSDLGTLRLSAAVSIGGRVTNGHGEPIAGARIEALNAPPRTAFDVVRLFRSVSEPDAVVARARSGKDGRYSLRVPKIRGLALRAAAPGYVQTSTSRRVFGNSTGSLDFQLHAGVPVSGVVVDERGDAVANARVLLVDPRKLWASEERRAETLTDAQGRFEFTTSPGDRRTLSVRVRGYAPASESELAPPATDLCIELERGISVRLRAVDAARPDVPVPDVAVAIWLDEGFAFARTDSRGEAHLAHVVLPESSWIFDKALLLWGGGFMPLEFDIEELEAQDGVLDAGDIALRRGGVLRGRVVDAPSGKPIAGAYVRALGGIEQILAVFASVGTRTGRDGSYELRGVPLGAHEVFVLHPDYMPSIPIRKLETMFDDKPGISLFKGGESEARRDVRLEPAATIRGVVRAPDGSPVAGAWVRIKGASDEDSLLLGEFHRAAVSETNGRFLLRGIGPAESVRVLAKHADHRASAPKAARAGEDITLTLVDAPRLEGLVVDAEGVAVTGVQIRTRRGTDENYGQTVAVTGDRGRFSLRGLEPGRLQLRFEHPGFAPMERSVEFVLNGPRCDVGPTRLHRRASVAGVVVDQHGQPMAGVIVRAAAADKSRHAGMDDEEALRTGAGVIEREAPADAEGRFRIAGLRKGHYRLKAVRDGFSSSRPIVATGITNARIRLLPVARLEGRVTGLGRPVAGASVKATIHTDGGKRIDIDSGRTNDEGVFALASLPPAQPFQLTIRHGDFLTLNHRGVRATRGVQEFVLDPGIRIAGTVTNAAGAPLRGVKVRVKSRAGTRRLSTDARGRFAAGGLPEGRLVVRVEQWDTKYLRTDAMVVEPGDENIRIVTEVGKSIAGVVRDVAGKPVTEFTIVILDAAGSRVRYHGLSGQSDGKFEIKGLRDGRYTVRVLRKTDSGPNKLLAEADAVAAGTRNLQFQVAR